MRTGVVAFGLLVVLVGCGPDGARARVTQGAAPTSPAGAAARALPSALVGQWSVTGSGVAPSTVVNLGERSLTLFADCGVLDGSWDARPGGLFLADAGSAGSGECFPPGGTTRAAAPGWLAAATQFAVDGERRLLRDRTGAELAVLAPGPRPTVPSTVADSVADAPQVPAERRAALDAERPALPGGVRPANRADVLGDWSVVGHTRTGGPSVSFAQDGRYTGSDGCNGFGGRWAVADGALLFTAGVSTQIGCENIHALAGATAVGVDGQELVLVDGDGTPTQRLTPKAAAR